MNREKLKYLIYELMTGKKNLDYLVNVNLKVINEFEEGMYCDKAYENVYNANQSLCEKLGNEDEDVECIISNLLNVCEYLSMKMYDYGEYYAKKTWDSNVEQIMKFYSDLSEDKKVKFMNLMYSIEKAMYIDNDK